MPLLAVTVLGHDRPGIIAETTGALAGLGLNLDDSTMTLLRGQFAMMLITDGAAGVAEVEAALGSLTADGTLSVSVREVASEEAAAVGQPWLLSVHGADRPGIVSAVVAPVAAAGGNITDLSTRLAGGLYVLTAELELPAGVDVPALQEALAAAAASVGVGASLRPVEADEL